MLFAFACPVGFVVGWSAEQSVTVIHGRFLGWLLVVVPLFCLCLLSQSRYGNLKVRVVYSDDRALDFRARLQLMSGAGNSAVGEAYTDDHGEAEFTGLAVGTYHIAVSGQGIQDSDSGVIDVDERKTTQSIMITVRRRGEGESHDSRSASVAASDLNVPSEAKSLFVQAGELMAKQSWKEAITKLERAVEIYPKYVGAYTNLGTAYARLGDSDRERQALNQALAIDPAFAPALLNLGMLETREKHYDSAEGLFAKASSADPTNVQILSLLAQCQLLDRHYDSAIATTEKVHSMHHDGYAVVHYIAARAFLHENRVSDAVREFELMLKEEPNGTRADAVRKELQVLENPPNSRPAN